MAKKNLTAPTEPALLFPIEGHTAKRDMVRAVSSNPGDHLRKINLDIIQIRPGHNPRSRNRPPEMSDDMWEKSIMISDLADKIFDSNGPAQAIIGDIHEDGRFYITDGERRFRALRLLIATGRDTYPNKEPVNIVLVMLNPPGTTDTERKKKAVAANSSLPLTLMQLAFHYLSFQEEEKWSHEQIAAENNVSRQTVDNYIIAATKFSKGIQDQIDTGELKMTTAITEWRRQQSELKKKTDTPPEETDTPFDDKPIITGKKADELAKQEKEKGKVRGDEEEFQEGDNTKDFPGSRSGPKEDSGSGAHVVGKDSIYMRQQKEAIFKRFFARYDVLLENARKLIVADKPEDETDEERAPILYQNRHEHAMRKMMEEYDITVR